MPKSPSHTTRSAKDVSPLHTAYTEQPEQGTTSASLIVVPTPIGNLGDITLRAIEALTTADYIYAEDTRVTAKLLSALDIERKRSTLLRLDENTMAEHAHDVIVHLEAGASVAYCSDAGMPGISDPGARLIKAVRERGLPLEVLPGASAASLAYVLSACECPRYYFGGFFPRKEKEQRKTLSELACLDAALIFYESPHRIADALASISSVFPHRQVSICRELTKLHEEIVQGSTGEVAAEFKRREQDQANRGEMVIVIDAPSDKEQEVTHAKAAEDAIAKAAELAALKGSQKDITKALMDEFGLSKNEAYQIALNAKHEQGV